MYVEKSLEIFLQKGKFRIRDVEIKENLCFEMLLQLDFMFYLGFIEGFFVLIFLNKDIFLYEGGSIFGFLIIFIVKFNDKL